MLDRIINKFLKIISLLVMLGIIIMLIVFGYWVFKKAFFPKFDTTATFSVNELTGKLEYLSLGRFSKIPGTKLMMAPLTSNFGRDNGYYSSFSGSQERARNYLLYNFESKKSYWLSQNNSSQFLSSYQILKDPLSRLQGRKADSSFNRDCYIDPNDTVDSIAFEVVLEDSNKDGQINENDKRALLHYNLAEQKLSKVLENVDYFLTFEQISPQELLVFFINDRKNYILSLNATSGELLYKNELAALEAKK